MPAMTSTAPGPEQPDGRHLIQLTWYEHGHSLHGTAENPSARGHALAGGGQCHTDEQRRQPQLQKETLVPAPGQGPLDSGCPGDGPSVYHPGPCHVPATHSLTPRSPGHDLQSQCHPRRPWAAQQNGSGTTAPFPPLPCCSPDELRSFLAPSDSGQPGTGSQAGTQ